MHVLSYSKNNGGLTPLHLAAMHGYAEVTKVLLAGSDVLSLCGSSGEVMAGWVVGVNECSCDSLGMSMLLLTSHFIFCSALLETVCVILFPLLPSVITLWSQSCDIMHIPIFLLAM